MKIESISEWSARTGQQPKKVKITKGMYKFNFGRAFIEYKGKKQKTDLDRVLANIKKDTRT